MGTQPASQGTFQLQWDLYENNLRNAFRDLRSNNKYFDVTVATEDGRAQAHRILLSACSPLLADILDNIYSPHPYVYLRGFKIKDFRAILDYVYKGEVSIPNEDLEDFLAAAEDLKIKGLAEDLYDESPLEQYSKDKNKNLQETLNDEQKSVHTDNTLPPDFIDDVQDIDQQKSTSPFPKLLHNNPSQAESHTASQISESTESPVHDAVNEEIDEETVDIGGFSIVSSLTPRRYLLSPPCVFNHNPEVARRNVEIAESEMILTHEEMADLESSIQDFPAESIDLDIQLAPISPDKNFESQNHIPMHDCSNDEPDDFDDDDVKSIEDEPFARTDFQMKTKEQVDAQMEEKENSSMNKRSDPRLICLKTSNKKKRKAKTDPKTSKVAKYKKVNLEAQKITKNIPNLSNNFFEIVPNKVAAYNKVRLEKISSKHNDLNHLIQVDSDGAPIMETTDLNHLMQVDSDGAPIMEKMPMNIPNLSDNLMETASALEQILPGRGPCESYDDVNTEDIVDQTIIEENQPIIEKESINQLINLEEPVFENGEATPDENDASNRRESLDQESDFPMQIYIREKTSRSRKRRSCSRSSKDALDIPLDDLPTQSGSAIIKFSSDLDIANVSDLLFEKFNASYNDGVHDRNAVLENGVDEIVLVDDDDDEDHNDKLILSNSLEDVEKLRSIFSSMMTVNQAGREWRCTECKQRFPGKNSRKYAEKHVDQTHTDHILHRCPGCDVLFKTIDALERHKEKVHRKSEKTRGRPKGKIIQYTYSS